MLSLTFNGCAEPKVMAKISENVCIRMTISYTVYICVHNHYPNDINRLTTLNGKRRQYDKHAQHTTRRRRGTHLQHASLTLPVGRAAAHGDHDQQFLTVHWNTSHKCKQKYEYIISVCRFVCVCQCANKSLLSSSSLSSPVKIL